MRRIFLSFTLLLLTTDLPASPPRDADPPPLVPPGHYLVLLLLADVAFRGDLEGLEGVRRRLAASPEDEAPQAPARRLYLLALADWHLSQAAAADPQRAVEAARRADDALRGSSNSTLGWRRPKPCTTGSSTSSSSRGP